MDLNETLAHATANGWSDDSAWTRSTVEKQVSSVIDGWQATVAVLTSGQIAWGITPEADHVAGRDQRGTARTFAEGMAACKAAVATAVGTLF